MSYVVGLTGELYEVPLSFFMNINIIKDNRIGNIHFMYLDNNSIWNLVQVDIRDYKIGLIL